VLLLYCRYFPRQFVELMIFDTRAQVTPVRSNEKFRLTECPRTESAPQSVVEQRFERFPSASREFADVFGKIVIERQHYSHESLCFAAPSTPAL
jgi:hypothetical protein